MDMVFMSWAVGIYMGCFALQVGVFGRPVTGIVLVCVALAAALYALGAYDAPRWLTTVVSLAWVVAGVVEMREGRAGAGGEDE